MKNSRKQLVVLCSIPNGAARARHTGAAAKPENMHLSLWHFPCGNKKLMFSLYYVSVFLNDALINFYVVISEFYRL